MTIEVNEYNIMQVDLLSSAEGSLDNVLINFGHAFVFNLFMSTGHISNKSTSSVTNGQFLAATPSDNQLYVRFHPPADINLKHSNCYH